MTGGLQPGGEGPPADSRPWRHVVGERLTRWARAAETAAPEALGPLEPLRIVL